ncbi:MAG TPA: MarR family transcriptional regulator [Opitutaceae bacterium]|jgi:DNA-binding MarR family transcriptional regulator
MHPVLHVFTTAQALEKAAARLFRPHGLTVAQFNVLNTLSGTEGMRASALADALIVDPSNVTGLLKRMTRDGLLREAPNTGDRRQYVVTLSPRGRAVWRRASAEYEARLAQVAATASGADLAALGRALDSFTRNVSQP